MSDCFRYCRFCPAESRVAEVLVWGDIQREKYDTKVCASRIHIIRELSWQEVSNICNIGIGNTGFGNTGNYNTGNYNSGNWNAGIFNTVACEYAFAFNQFVRKQDLECLPSIPFLHFSLCGWIPEKHMLPEEKTQHPEYITTGGYFKKYDYKEAFRKSFEEARRRPDWSKQRQMLLDLPNFDADIFEEISGITPNELGISAKELADKTKTVMEVTVADIEKKYGCKVKIVKEK